MQVKVLKDSNYTVLRKLIGNLDTVKQPNRYVNIYYVDNVNNTHSVNKLKILQNAFTEKETGWFKEDWKS